MKPQSALLAAALFVQGCTPNTPSCIDFEAEGEKDAVADLEKSMGVDYTHLSEALCEVITKTKIGMASNLLLTDALDQDALALQGALMSQGEQPNNDEIRLEMGYESGTTSYIEYNFVSYCDEDEKCEYILTGQEEGLFSQTLLQVTTDCLESGTLKVQSHYETSDGEIYKATSEDICE